MTKSEAVSIVLNDLSKLTVSGVQNVHILDASFKNLTVIYNTCKKEEEAAAEPDKGEEESE